MLTLENIGDGEYVFKTDIDDMFTARTNRASGNCLFESLSQSVYGNMTKQADIRRLVCDFRKNVSDFSPNNLLEIRVKEFLEADVSDLSICSDKEYALALDVLIAAVVLKKNIILFTDKENSRFSENKIYNVENFKYDLNVDTIYLLFRPYSFDDDYDPNHFESLMLKKEENMSRVKKSTHKTNDNDNDNEARIRERIKEENDRKLQELEDEIYALSLVGGRKRYTVKRKIKRKRKIRTRKSR
jgi:hypothetical protein